MADAGAALLSFLATAWLHALALCGVAFLLERVRLVRTMPAREALWRGALLLPLLTAGVALAVDRGALRLAPAGLVAAPAAPTVAAAAPAGAPPGVRTLDVPAPPPTAAMASAARPLPDRVVRTPAAWIEPLAADRRWPLAVALGWLLLATAGAALALHRLLRLRRRLLQRRSPSDAGLAREALRIARSAGLRGVNVAQDPGLASPVALAPDWVGMPAWSDAALPPAQRRAMLAHEVAHLARRDPQWRIATRAAAGLLPTPLSTLALRRLDDLAELQCDAWAAHATGDPRALAECIAECLSRGRAASVPELAVPMAVAQSPLVERVRRLIEEKPMPSPALALPRRLAIVAVLAGVAAATPHVVFGDPRPDPPAPPAAPGAPSPPADPADPADPAAPPAPPAPPAAPTGPAAPMPPAPLHGSTSVTDLPFFGRTTTVSLRGGGYALEVKARGEFSFNDAEDDIATLDGWLEIEEQVDGVTRRVRFDEGDGRIERRFHVDGAEVAADEATRSWLRRAIPAMLRATGLDAERRVARILARGGANAVLDETALIASTHVRATYIARLSETVRLDPAQQDRAIALAGAMDSDYERRRALESLLEHQSLAAAQQVALHRVAATIESDYEQRVLLEAAIPALRRAPAAASGWLAALEDCESSYEHRVALESLAAAVALEADALAQALASAARIDSDYERRLALAALAAQVGRAAALTADYAQAVAGIHSDYEAREALVALVAELPPSAENLAPVIDAVSGIESDYEARQVLVEVAARMPNDATLIERYRAAARRLGSHERGEAERALDRLYEA